MIIKKIEIRRCCYCFIFAVLNISVFLFILEIILRFGIIKNRLYDRKVCIKQTIDSKYKILMLGDSFTYLIADFLLPQLKPYKAKILNTARGGYGPFDYAMEMEIEGITLYPHITILFYYAGNDLTNVQYNRQYKTDLKNSIRNFFRPISRRLYLYHFYKDKLNELYPKIFDYNKFSENGIDSEIISLAKKGEVNPWLLEIRLEHKNYLLDNILMETPDNMMAWEKIKKLLAQIQGLCNKIDSEFVIVIFPSTVQVNRTEYAFYRNLNFNVDERMASSNKPQKLLKDFCEERKIPCLDLLPYLKAEHGKELYIKNDDHLNWIGNELSSKIIIDFLIKNTSLGKDVGNTNYN